MEKKVKIFYKNKLLLNALLLTKNYEIARGLMFTVKLKNQNGVILVVPDYYKNRFQAGIHMLFVFYSLNILFLDEDYKIVDLVRLPPFYPIYIPKKLPKYVVETSENVIKKYNLKIGDKLEFK